MEPENWGEQELQKTTEIEAAPSTTGEPPPLEQRSPSRRSRKGLKQPSITSLGFVKHHQSQFKPAPHQPLSTTQSEDNLGTHTEKPKIDQTPDCNFDKKGYCITHQELGEKFTVTRIIWKDRGKYKGFGNVSQKVV